MERSEFSQNRIIRLIKEGFKEKPILSELRKRNLDKIVSNSIELASQKQRNKQLDRTVTRLVEERPKKGIIGFLNSMAKWQIAMLSIFALVFITSGVALANPSISENIKTALSINTGKIEITSNILNANVYLKNKNDKDFKLVGTTNFTLNKADQGEYEFYLQKDGFVQTDIVHFILNKSGFYTKYVSLQEQVDQSKIKYIDFTNQEFGISLKYPETITPNFERYSDDSFKLSIKSGDAIFVLQSQNTQPTLLPDFTKTEFKIAGKTILGRKYIYKNSTESFSKEAYKYGVVSDGLFTISGINYFIYSESLTESNPLFDNIIKDLSLTKIKQVVKDIKKYKFNDSKLGISFDYFEDFIYSTEINTTSEYKVRLENKNNKNLVMYFDWKSTPFGTTDNINFSDSSNITKTILNSSVAYTFINNSYEIAYILPNNIAIYAYKYGSSIEADRLLKQKDLFLQTFQTSNTNLGSLTYPYQTSNSSTTTIMPTFSSSSATSSYKPKD